MTEEGAMTEVLKSPTFTRKSPSRKANKLLCSIFKKRRCQKENSCNYWHVPEYTKLKTPGGCTFGDKCAYKHTAKSADEKRNSASNAIHIPSNNEQQMQFVRLHHLANKYVLKTENLGPSHGVDLRISEIQVV